VTITLLYTLASPSCGVAIAVCFRQARRQAGAPKWCCRCSCGWCCSPPCWIAYPWWVLTIGTVCYLAACRSLVSYKEYQRKDAMAGPSSAADAPASDALPSAAGGGCERPARLIEVLALEVLALRHLIGSNPCPRHPRFFVPPSGGIRRRRLRLFCRCPASGQKGSCSASKAPASRSTSRAGAAATDDALVSTTAARRDRGGARAVNRGRAADLPASPARVASRRPPCTGTGAGAQSGSSRSGDRDYCCKASPKVVAIRCAFEPAAGPTTRRWAITARPSSPRSWT